ncbi:MAG: NYN domain-containing protein [Euryarchaeota archaeon]|nr:NYN domain-containing protein [Euryarchaeota archaeon]
MTTRSLMIFIDGAYLRECFKKFFGHDRIKFDWLARVLFGEIRGDLTGKAFPGSPPDLVRVYYYDAYYDTTDVVSVEEENHIKTREDFEKINENQYYEVKLARLKKCKGRLKQKGVDVFLATDMVNKAHLNHYDIALLVTGDDDYLDLVKTVKDIGGKLVFGAYDPETASKELVRCFDHRYVLSKDFLKDCVFQEE